jgi:protein-disulfide isomerase
MSKKNRATDRAARAAAAIAEQRRQERRRRNLMVGGVVIGLVLIVAAGFLISRSLDNSTDVDAAAPSSSSEYGVTIGPDDAPNKLVIYEDFLCPFCGELEKRTHEELAQLAADGNVQIEYRPFNLLSTIGDYSERSAGAFSIVLDKSGSDVAKKFHDLLYENQPSESASSFPDNSQLAAWAVEAGAKESDVRGPIEANDGKAWVTKATRAASDAGVQSTPTILLNGEVFQDGRTVDDLANNLIAKLK